MKNKIFNFISKSNQILFFLVAIGLIVVMVISLLPHDYSRPAVKIERNLEQNSTKETLVKNQYFKSFYSHINDIFIIKVYADNIVREEILHYSAPRSSSSDFYNQNKHALVNLIFAKEGKKSYKLLKDDAYITSLNIMKNNQTVRKEYADSYFKLEKNIYTIVTHDTNNDDFLTSTDQRNFYISNYDGKQLKLILKDIVEYKLVDDNLVLITKKVKKEEQFYLFNILENDLKLLDTKI